MYDRWYCSPYALSIAFQLQEAIPHSHAEQIRQVAQNEGAVLSRIQGLMLLITLAALLASALAVSAVDGHRDFRAAARSWTDESAGRGQTDGCGSIFCRGRCCWHFWLVSLGFAGGALLAHQIGQSIFDSQITIQPVASYR